MLWKKVTSLTRLIKNEYEDQLWLFAIILVMLLLAIAGLSSWKGSKNAADVAIEPSPTVPLINSKSAEISLAQVQVIVSKPMADLMAMQVYDESRVQNSYELVAQSSINESGPSNNVSANKVLRNKELQNRTLRNNVKQQSAAIYLSEANLSEAIFSEIQRLN